MPINPTNAADTHNSLTVEVHGIHHVASASFAFAHADSPSPMHTLLRALGECTLITLHGMCQRQRQQVEHYHCRIEAQQQAAHPQVFRTIAMHFSVVGDALSPERLHHAVALLPKYCPVHATLAHTSAITHTITIVAKDAS